MRAFVVLGLVFSIPSQEIDLGKHVRNDLFCVEWNVKPQFSQSVSQSISVVPGLLQADPSWIRDNRQIFRLFCHEALRVFHDRLISYDDKDSFYVILAEMAGRYFGEVCITGDCDFLTIN